VPGIVEVNVNVSRMVVELRIVEALNVMFWVVTEKLVVF
jgi:hypothetical protein